MFPLDDYDQRALNITVKDFFLESIAVENGAFLFFYQDQYKNTATEYWAPGQHLVPVTPCIWLVYKGLAAQVRHLFLSHSAADILCFCQLNPNWLKIPGTVAFAAVGLLATAGQVGFLKGYFPNAIVHTIFDSGLTGRVTDCKIALWIIGKDGSFRVADDQVHIIYKSFDFSIPTTVFSLNRFERTIAIRSKIRTHKPKSCLSSYRQFFVDTC